MIHPFGTVIICQNVHLYLLNLDFWHLKKILWVWKTAAFSPLSTDSDYLVLICFSLGKLTVSTNDLAISQCYICISRKLQKALGFFFFFFLNFWVMHLPFVSAARPNKTVHFKFTFTTAAQKRCYGLKWILASSLPCWSGQKDYSERLLLRE